MSYLLLADGHLFKCQSWDGLVDKLVWARDQGVPVGEGATWTSAITDRVWTPSERVALA